jgi:hypothetical protein
MSWDLDRSQEEFQWLRLVSAVKYDSYRDFLAGMRFLESLVGWLLQFKEKDREAAYDFVRNRLTFISAVERERLVEIMYPRTVLPLLLKDVAKGRKIAPWQVYCDADARHDLDVARRRTLFLGLSDGARLDSFRHVNVGRISNEQVVVGTQLDNEKWDDLKKELSKGLIKLESDKEASFDTIYLVDDFAGSGTSFIRLEEEDGKREWKGKLLRFLRSLERGKVQSKGWKLIVHHLIVTDMALEHLNKAIEQARNEISEQLPWFTKYEVTWSYHFPTDFPLTQKRDAAFHQLTQDYYDDRIQTPATKKGGIDNLGLGYAGCALPLILDHNTPNNSLALLWAESRDDKGAHDMRPLFRRRQRHTS